ncbi:E3 ubiquitin-protein ligase MARCH1 [Trichinella nativa]|uniref:E3 ubiquitin-protein ligase MARCH1 n=1 Tax=Trichinella nativa TaxID=6335 RepID=A0A0V1LHH1_9BILA|nr:E3 ubiquitin-protein ligase MARCH1 [Trichinella nativa]
MFIQPQRSLQLLAFLELTKLTPSSSFQLLLLSLSLSFFLFALLNKQHCKHNKRCLDRPGNGHLWSLACSNSQSVHFPNCSSIPLRSLSFFIQSFQKVSLEQNFIPLKLNSVMPTNEENQIKAENVGEDPSCCDCSSAFLLNMPLPSENSQLLAVEQPLFVGGISQLGESKESIATSSNGSQSLCRICHLPAARGNPLITPCRCSGSLRHVHKTCLLHWLEISSTKVSPSPQCELCGYTYKTHHCFSVFLAVFRTAQCPHCTRRDCTLHLVFIAMLMLMSSCAFISVLYLSQDDGLRTRNILNRQDITVISCSLLFFVAFFVAIFTQYRSETSLFCLFARCWLINRHWRIKNYNPNSEIKKDDVNI